MLSLSCSFLTFSEPENSTGEVLSLKQIDLLIDASAYNDALDGLYKYIQAHPNDFDRAQKRISKIMKLREAYNKGAGELVSVIKSENESKSDKLMKITELENSELEPNENVIEFTNMARRTVTLGEVLVLYEKIMRQGASLIKKEEYSQAALKFQEGFVIKNEVSDLVFDIGSEASSEGRLVVYESDITEPVRKAVGEIRNMIAPGAQVSLDSLINECEKAYNEYIKAISAKNIDSVIIAMNSVNTAFEKFANVRNSIVERAKVLEKAEALANERNPLLLGTSYITFQQRFIMGDESNPDTGIIAAYDAYFNRRVESMKSKTSELVLELLNRLIKNLPENKIYSLADNIPAEQKNVSAAERYAQAARFIHDLYNLLKNLDGSSVGKNHAQYALSMGFVGEYLADLDLSYGNVISLAAEKKSPEILDKNNLAEQELSRKLEKLFRYEKIKSDSASYISLVEDEQKREKEYFDKKSKTEKEIDELVRLSGGKLRISSAKKRTSAGVQIIDNPLDFRNQIAYFNSICRQNLEESSFHAQRLWGFMAYAYATLGEKSYDYYKSRCDETENLLTGGQKAGSQGEGEIFSSEFIKKYPVEAKNLALKLNQEIMAKKAELLEKKNLLSGGSEYASLEKDYDDGISSLDVTIKNFDSLFAKNEFVVNNAIPKIRDYEILLRDAQEQYKLALAAFKKDDFENATAAVDSSSEKFAQALDIEFSDEIQKMREVTLNELAMKIQRAEYEKVLREVYSIKDKAAIAYYSSNFDLSENLLASAQAKWARVSTEADSEIEELLGIVRTIKSIEYGRVLLQSDPHYPELSYSLDMARQSLEKGSRLKKQGEAEKAKEAFQVALMNIRNVQNVYPLNKEARLLALKIQQELDPEGFPRQFENQYNAARLNANKNERLADLEDLYEINPKYPGLAQEIYEIKDSLGMFPKKVVKKEVKKSADSKIAETRRAFRAAGDDEAKLNQALRLANEAIAIDGTSKEAKELKLEIQLKIGATSTAILSQNDEKMYAEAARLFNQRRFADAKTLMDRLLTGAAAKKSRKVIDLYNRLLKRL